MRLHWLSPDSAPDSFPNVKQALDDPPGLLAAGGDLSVTRLVAAYRRGIFPWYEQGQPILWWSPDPRAVLLPERLHVSRSLRRTIRKQVFRLSTDREFAAVVSGCAARRSGETGTWITPEMAWAYGELHRLGFAHSVESWQDGVLVGGIYGVSLGRVFFAESMFSRVSDASKVALVDIVRRLQGWGYSLIDCQMPSAHLYSMGASLVPRQRFVAEVERLTAQPPDAAAWARQGD